MSLFFVLLGKLLPLYLLIGAGYIVGALFHLKRQVVALILLYVLSPLVVLEGGLTAHLTRATLLLPLIFLFLCSALCLIFLAASSLVWRKNDSMRNLAAFASANGNTGYFGIPAAMALFPSDVLGLVVLCSLGFLLYESSVGFFVLARGNYTFRESVGKLLKLPLLYAFALGVILNMLHFSPSPAVFGFLHDVRGAYSVLGMMLIGLGLAGEKFSAVDSRLLGFTTVAKCVIWPTLMMIIIMVDRQALHFFGEDVHGVMLLMAMVPLAVNTVVYSSVLKVHPEKAAVAVMVSTLLALFMIPALSVLFL
ncbi:MAG: hypothetical protein PHE68_01150 [Candidatus Peribacteraceae bacterium]|nr:hypothetical protein [Candidatus Peribacteraceae bacterium]MDD5074415.1 hypothetical protein [Candidatus Peribacteraceae bacterium]